MQGKYISPSNFTQFADVTDFGVQSFIFNYRWIPHIRDSERSTFEAYGRQYYSNNFTIMTQSNGTSFPAANATDYYPLAISVPSSFMHNLIGYDLLSIQKG